MGTPATVLDDTRTAGPSARERERRSPALMRVEVTLLGGFAVRIDGREISSNHWSRRHSAALVKLLAITPGRSLHREQLIDALWPDLSIDDAAPRLHKAAHYARKALGHQDAVVLSAETVRLCPQDDVHVDVVQFQQLAASAVEIGGIAAAKGALAVYGGELLPHDLYEPWAEHLRRLLGRLYLELLHQAEDWHQALTADPADEPAHLALVQRYAERGDRAAALRQLDQLDQVMRRELGLEPSGRARDLRRQVLATAGTPNSGVVVRAVGPVAPQSQACVDPHRQCCADY
jgi:DNA-binding SARP family transcriptional activator